MRTKPILLCFLRSGALLFAIGGGLFSAGSLAAQEIPVGKPTDKEMLKTLKKEHPRLFTSRQELFRLSRVSMRDPVQQSLRERLLADATKIIDEPPVEHVLIGPRLLDKSRKALDRISKLALAYRLSNEVRFAERAKKELLTVCAFADWNPSHFLDVAEMTTACAIGYDWLYDFLAPEDRKTIKNAIVNLGLKPSLPLYHAQQGWTIQHHNWNQVCNGGMTVGALAIADEEPELAAYILARATESVPRAMQGFAPDGGCNEGPGYWNYATQYNVYMLAALDSALANSFGLDKLPCFALAGLFRVYFSSPLKRTFNYADVGSDQDGTAPQMFWFARHYDQPLYAWAERSIIKTPSAFDLIWFDNRGSDPRSENLPLARLFRGVDVAFMRSAWQDEKAVWIGFKGGDNKANHSHLDLGSFVLEADGKRWAMDLGSDNYNLPGYFDTKKQRWTYYRMRTESHNTLTLDGKNQSQSGTAPITIFSSTPTLSYAIADLTKGYAGQAQKVERGIALLDKKRVLVQDELTAEKPVSVLWNLMTPAQIALDPQNKRMATLEQEGVKMSVRLLEPAGASFEVGTAAVPEPQNPNKGAQKLLVRLPQKTTKTRIIVLFLPASSGTADYKPDIKPLALWSTMQTARAH